MSRPLLLGQAPGPKTDPGEPLHPATSLTGRRLASLFGLEDHQYLTAFDRANLLYEYPGKVGKEDRFPMAEAKRSALTLAPLLAGRTVVLLGRNVCSAFRLDALPWFTWSELPLGSYRQPAVVACIPHPSGRCRIYNDPASRDQAASFLRELVEQKVEDGRCLLRQGQREEGQTGPLRLVS